MLISVNCQLLLRYIYQYNFRNMAKKGNVSMDWIHKMEKEEKERRERRALLNAESSESDFSSSEDNGGWGKDWEERVSSSEDEKPGMSMFNIDIFIINLACSP